MIDVGQSKSITNITHGVVAVGENNEILRFVGFWNEPSDDALRTLKAELDADLQDIPYTLYHATPDIINQFK